MGWGRRTPLYIVLALFDNNHIDGDPLIQNPFPLPEWLLFRDLQHQPWVQA